MNYFYSVNNSSQRHLLGTHHGCSYQQLGEMAARLYHYSQNGDKADWPLRINLYKTEDSPLLATVKVNLVMEPHFQGEVILESSTQA